MASKRQTRGLAAGCAVALMCLLAACGGKRLDHAGLDSGRPDGSVDGPDGKDTNIIPQGGLPNPTSAECMQAACNAAVSDLCCPPACTAATDVDCGGCGNGRLEAGEVCDPLESCPTSCPQLKCEKQRLKSAGTCADVCVSAGPQTACQDGDECCPAGCTSVNDRDCTASCDNGTLEPTELCDPLASCPTTCPMRGCTLLTLKDAGTCLAHCVEAGQQTMCQSDDGCCPAGCNAGNDNDCGIVCGNGAIEGQETCDPLASCPQACPADGCRLRRLVNAGTCTAACIDDGLQTMCKNGDGCCPVGCNATNDNDCSVLCGNGVVEAGETCDPIASCMQKEAACVSDSTTTRTRSGDSGKCTFACVATMRTCGAADGACPPGCGPTMDRDCPGCGNGVVEAGETCDPVADCQAKAKACVSDNNTVRTPAGDPAACTFTCSSVPRVCGAADGACPAGCTAARDADCVGCGNGVVEAGETCDPVADCQAKAKACVSDNATVRTPQGDPTTCRFACQETPRLCGTVDGVCPANCGPTQDRDCVGCGNGRVDPGETCDPCNASVVRTCVSDEDVVRTPVGSPMTCNFVCMATPRACAADGFCPKACTPANDPDCRPGPGEACDPKLGCSSGSCTDGRCCVQTCKTCQACTGAGGSCVNIPSGQPDNVPVRACPAPSTCNGQGGCVAPCLVASPASHDFGTVALGGTVGMRISFTNTCASAVIPAVTVAPAEFTLVANGCTTALAFKSGCTVSVEWRPSSVGRKTGQVAAAIAGGATTTVPLVGTAVMPAPALLSFKPAEVVFASAAPGIARQETVTLINSGAATGVLTLSLPQGPFTIVAHQCASLVAGGTCPITLRFAPTSAQRFTAALTAQAAAGGTASLPLSGQGSLPVIPVIPPLTPLPAIP